jgi:3-phenylpropionate/cinnamic acid dioxygenase small subunit
MDVKTESSTLAAVLERLQRLEEERAILDTLYRYAHAFDDRRYDDVLDCFTEDGAFVYVQRPEEEPLFERRGPDLRTFFEEHDVGRPWGDVTHVHLNPRVVAVRGDEAEAISYYGTLQQRPDRSAVEIMSMGRYLDRLVRGSDGVWRILERRAERDSPRPDRAGETDEERNARVNQALGLAPGADTTT